MLLVIGSAGVFALTNRNVCAEAVVTDISPSSVEIDEEFTIGISIESCGSKSPEEVHFEIIQPSPDLLIKEPLLLKIGALHYANSNRFVTYHMRTTQDAKPGTYVIEMRLTYRSEGLLFTENSNVSINVTSDDAELALASAKTNPTFPIAGKPVTITLRLENFGRGDANSIKADLVGLESFVGSKKAFLGELAAEEDGILSFNLVPEKAGDYTYEMVVNYRDDFGDHVYREQLQIVVESPKRNLLQVFLIVCVLGAIGAWIAYRMYVQRKQAHAVALLQRRGR